MFRAQRLNETTAAKDRMAFPELKSQQDDKSSELSQPSKFDSSIRISDYQCSVTLLCLNRAYSWYNPFRSQEHACLFVEGYHDSKYWYTRADFFLAEGSALQTSTQSTLGRGLVIETSNMSQHKEFLAKYKNKLSITWACVPEVAAKINAAITSAAGGTEHLSYSKSGHQPSSFPDNVHNCISWCLKILRDVGILDESWSWNGIKCPSKILKQIKKADKKYKEKLAAGSSTDN